MFEKRDFERNGLEIIEQLVTEKLARSQLFAKASRCYAKICFGVSPRLQYLLFCAHGALVLPLLLRLSLRLLLLLLLMLLHVQINVTCT